VRDRHAVDPGSTVRGRVLIRPYRGEAYWEAFELPVPASVPGNELIVEACDGGSLLEREFQRAPGRYEPASLDDLFRLVGELPSRDKIYVRLYTTEARGLVLNGHEMGPLPSSTAAVFGSRRQSGSVTSTQASALAEMQIETGVVTTGQETLKIRIQRPAGPAEGGDR
jgi:hypothetical protein